jgi:hypothetical protein
MLIVDYIFCDDIRTEQLNKHSLMGVFNDLIRRQVPQQAEIKWPIPLRLCCFLRFRVGPVDEIPDSFSFDYLMNGKQIIEAGMVKGSLTNVKRNEAASISILGQFPVEEGNLGFRVVFKKGEKELQTISVNQGVRLVVDRIVSA